VRPEAIGILPYELNFPFRIPDTSRLMPKKRKEIKITEVGI
jgi:hypothetical protein